MKIVIAIDSFKGSSTTAEAAEAVERGIKKVFCNAEIIKIPVADGGEGTVNTLVLGMNGIFKEVEVIGPMGEKINAKYGILDGDLAIIEMAAASGLLLVPEDKRNPMVTTTYGTGQLIKAALDEGCKRILIGIGGSATNDGGSGMAQALGASFKDQDGNELGFGGGKLSNLVQIDISNMDSRIKNTEIWVASDVSNPLCGVKGASIVYGPQKGANLEMALELDNNLCHYAIKIKEQLGRNIIDIPGAGAAGGLGAGLMAFCNATLQPGIETVLNLINIDKYLLGADLVITGEGKIDEQSIYGKVPVGVAKRAQKYNIPVLVIAGSIGKGASAAYKYGIDGLMSIVNEPMELKQAMNRAGELIEEAAERALRIINIGRIMKRED